MSNSRINALQWRPVVMTQPQRQTQNLPQPQPKFGYIMIEHDPKSRALSGIRLVASSEEMTEPNSDRLYVGNHPIATSPHIADLSDKLQSDTLSRGDIRQQLVTALKPDKLTFIAEDPEATQGDGMNFAEAVDWFKQAVTGGLIEGFLSTANRQDEPNTTLRQWLFTQPQTP